METIIKISELTKSYDNTKVLDIPDLSIEKGEMLGLVGNNGAGKTTLFRMILDLSEPGTGLVEIKGMQVRLSEDWKSFTGSFLDEGFLIDYLTPDEFFSFIGKLHQLSSGEINQRLTFFESFFNGEIRGNRKLIRDLSKGNQKKVGIAGALLPHPEIVLLDEPFANLDPSSQFKLRNLLKKWQHDFQTTLLISSHDLGHVTEFCQRIIVLQKGLVIKDLQTNQETLRELELFFNAGLENEQEVALGDEV